MQAAQRDFASEDEYLERERRAESKHEYLNGEIVAMAGASMRHNLINSRLQMPSEPRWVGGSSPLSSERF